jgi:hypothetical protein
MALLIKDMDDIDTKEIEDHSSDNNSVWKAEIETGDGEKITVQYASDDGSGKDPLATPDKRNYRLRKGEKENIKGDYEEDEILVLDIDRGDIGYGAVDVYTLVPEEKVITTYLD